MGRHSTLKINESEDYLRRLKDQSQSIYSKDRLQALLLIKTKVYKKRSDIALAIGVHSRTLERWLQEYREFGLDFLLTSNRGGARRSCMNDKAHKALAEKLSDSENPLLSYTDAVRWFSENIGYSLTYITLRNYMIRNFKTKLKSPRKSHYKKDEQAIEAFKKTTRCIVLD